MTANARGRTTLTVLTGTHTQCPRTGQTVTGRIPGHMRPWTAKMDRKIKYTPETFERLTIRESNVELVTATERSSCRTMKFSRRGPRPRGSFSSGWRRRIRRILNERG